MPPPHKGMWIPHLPSSCLPPHGHRGQEAPPQQLAGTCVPCVAGWDKEEGWRGEARTEKCELTTAV